MSSDNEAPKKLKPLFRVRVSRLSNGERLPILVDQRGLPVPIPNQWALFIRRPLVQANTLTEDLRTVAHIYDWAARRGIDLDERQSSGNGLRPNELSSLFQNLRYARVSGREQAGKTLADVRGVAIVSRKVHATRVGSARAYLVWGMESTPLSTQTLVIQKSPEYVNALKE